MKPGVTSIVAVMLVVGLASAFFAQVPKPFERSATSSVETSFDKDGFLIVTTVNRKFSFTEFSPQNKFADEQRTTLLPLEEFTASKELGADEQKSTIKVDAWFSRDANPSRVSWTIQQEGDVGERLGRFYRVTKYGCCMTPSTDVYFSLMTGQLLFMSTKALYEIVAPNSKFGPRYIAYLSTDNSLSKLRGEKGLVGVLQYGSEKEVISAVAIHSLIAADDLSLDVKILHQKKRKTLTDKEPLMLWDAVGKTHKSSPSGFSIVLDSSRAGDIVMPVENDAIDIKAASVSRSFTVGPAAGMLARR